MAYDRFDPRYDRDNGRFGRENSSRGSGRWSDDDRRWRGDSRRDEDRGWFERAGDEIASWFRDDDDDRRAGERGWGREADGSIRQTPWGSRNREPWGSGQFDRGPDRDRFQERERDYRPMAGDYSRSEPMMTRGGLGRGFEERQRSQGWGGGSTQGIHDPHYHSWRQRQSDELDRDYDEYRRENQSRFETEFGGWRERRQQKRSLLGTVREHMEVVGSDDQAVGTVDRVAGDRLILTRSDPEAGGHHHSISCSNIDRIEDNRVILDCSADQAKQSWRNEDASRGMTGREERDDGPHILNRSFEGTYR